MPAQALQKIRNLDYVILLCEDIEPMKSFYQEVMGFQIHRDDGEWVEMKIGASLLTLRKRGRPYDGAKLANTASVQLAFRVAPVEVEACYQQLLAKHVEILDPPRDTDYGHRTLFFHDPEGNILEIYADI
jgi:catechol 2,3-dioxygenase-like lactoylglutathione lyase family enzyme